MYPYPWACISFSRFTWIVLALYDIVEESSFNRIKGLYEMTSRYGLDLNNGWFASIGSWNFTSACPRYYRKIVFRVLLLKGVTSTQLSTCVRVRITYTSATLVGDRCELYCGSKSFNYGVESVAPHYSAPLEIGVRRRSGIRNNGRFGGHLHMQHRFR